MRNFIILGLALILLYSCGNEEKPKVIYPEDGNAETTELKKDSTLIEIADIPIAIATVSPCPISNFHMIYDYCGI